MKPPILVSSPRVIKDEYAEFAQQEDMHAMSGRSSKETTQGLNNATIEHANLSEGRSILDVGCGDGYLLQKLGRGTGVTLTEEEAARLRRQYSSIKILVGDMRTLDSGERYDRIIINSTLHLLGKKAHILQCLSNLYRLALPDAFLWIGDHPSSRDAQTLRSPVKALKYIYRRQGAKVAIRYAKHIWRRRDRAGKILVKDSNYPSTPEATVAMANACGFDLVRMWSAKEIPATSPDRFFYLFKRPARPSS